MLVANSFDLWQKDAFFSAAEEVQQSADTMESAYRAWRRARKEGSVPQQLEELAGELQMALGTAKWQLEEFERAVFLSYKGHGNDVMAARHKEFISAMEHQISQVENDLMDHFVEGKKPFRWVNLDEDERDDLANFLSGISATPQWMPSGGENRRFQTATTGCLDQEKNREEVTSSSDNKNCFTDSGEARSSETQDQVSYPSDRIVSTYRARGSSHQDLLEIVIDRNEAPMDPMIEEATPKDKASKGKSYFWRSRCSEHSDAKGADSFMHGRIIGWMHQSLRIRQSYKHLVSPVKSLRTVLILMLTILLVVPFLMYTT